MFVTNDPDLYEQVLTLSNHGRARSQNKQFWPDMVGFKYKMSNIQAAIGCAQMKRIDELVDRKIDILNAYKDEFIKLGISYQGFNYQPNGCSIGAWMSTVVLESPAQDSRLSQVVQTGLNKKGIDARPFFAPLSSTPPFFSHLSGYKHCKFSYSIPPVSINLPCSHEITQDDIHYVSTAISELIP